MSVRNQHSEIKSFIRICLQPILDDEYNDFGDFIFVDLNGDETINNRTCFLWYYLKENEDINYGCFIENGEMGLHFLYFSL